MQCGAAAGQAQWEQHSRAKCWRCTGSCALKLPASRTFFLTKRATACKHDQLLQAEPPAVPGEVAPIAVATSPAVTSKHQQPTSTNSNCCSTAAPPHRTQHTARSTHHCTRCLARSSAPLSESCLPGTPASLPAAAAAWRSDPE